MLKNSLNELLKNITYKTRKMASDEEISKNTCFICLNSDNILKNIESNSSTNDLTSKLIYCIPELKWNFRLFVCATCNDKLDTLCAFKNECLRSYLNARKTASNEITTEIELDNQLDKENGEVCELCDIKFVNLAIFKAHTTIFHAVENVTQPEEVNPNVEAEIKSTESENHCKLCGTTCATKYLLNRHVKNVHASAKNFECDLCDQKFASNVYLNAHKKYHSRERLKICKFCGKRYITASDLYHHEKIHLNKRGYQCDKCPKAFKTSSDLHKHRVCCHSDRDTWKYTCSYCTRKFPLKTNLDSHLKTHTGEKNHKCHLCEYRGINRSVLQRHIESHSNVKLFKCDLCSTEYKYKYSLDLHLKKVHGIGDKVIKEVEKKFYCELCPKGFAVKSRLEKHLRTHTGEKPFACTFCDKRFIDKSYVKQHIKIVHGL